MNVPDSWLPIAQTLGFASEKEMLEELYVKQQLSCEDLAKKLGYSRNNIRSRLRSHNIPIRGRGGKNRGVSKDLAAISDDVLTTTTTTELGRKLGMHPSAIYKEKRRRGLCTSVSLPQQVNSINTLPEAPTMSSSLHTVETPSTLNGTDNEDELEIFLS